MVLDYSVIVPVFNGEKFIVETLLSIEAQTLLPFEIIVVDDCSTDSTAFLVEEFAANSHAPVKFIQIDANSGSAAKPRNKGLEVVGDVQYLAFCDADDIWNVNKMSMQLKFMEQKKSIFSFAKVKYFNDSSEITQKKLPSQTYRNLGIKDFRFDNCVKSCSTAVISKAIIPYCNFPEGNSYLGVEDYCCWLGILSRVDRVDQIKSELTFYRQHPGSISSSKLKCIMYRFNSFGYKKRIFAENSIYLPNFIVSETIYILKQLFSKLCGR